MPRDPFLFFQEASQMLQDDHQAQKQGGIVNEAEASVRRERREYFTNMFNLRALSLQRAYGVEPVLDGGDAVKAMLEARADFERSGLLKGLVEAEKLEEKMQVVVTPWGTDHTLTFAYLVRLAADRWFHPTARLERVWVGDEQASAVFPRIDDLPPKPFGWWENAELRQLYSRNGKEDFVPVDQHRKPGVTSFPLRQLRFDVHEQDLCEGFVIDPVYRDVLSGKTGEALRYIGETVGDPGTIDVRQLDVHYGWEPWHVNARMKELSSIEVFGSGMINGKRVALAGPEVLALLATDPGFRFRIGSNDFPNLLLSGYRITVGEREAIPTLIRRLNRLELGYYFFDESKSKTAHLAAPKVILS